VAGSAGAEKVLDEHVNDVLDLVRAAGGRVTTSRRLLVRTLLDGSSHRSAEQIAADVQVVAPDVHLSTIYRNLDELARLGVVTHAHLGHGPASYHLATENHGHFVCKVCGAVFEAPAAFFADLARRARQELDFAIDPQHFAVVGTCRACAQAARRVQPPAS
jgi:Fur family ferric uptake transcriptional regulator